MLKRLFSQPSNQFPSPMNMPTNNPMINPGINPTVYPNNSFQTSYPNQTPTTTSYDINRFQTEINELKRINSDMLKRISRLENYLGIRGDSENIW